jgi:hypothetical protein
MLKPFFHMAIKHPYYADMRCPDFEIIPHDKCKSLIQSCRLGLTSYSNGISVWIPVENGNPAMAIPQDVTFSFFLFLKNVGFSRITEMAPVAGTRVYSRMKGTDVLKFEEQAAGLAPADAFGVVTVTGITFTEDAPVFNVLFEARKMKWRYLLVSDETSLDGFTIEQTRTGKDGKKIEFKAPRLTNQKMDDAMLKVIDQDYPGAGKAFIESKEPVACLQYGRKNIQLTKDKIVLVDHLPNPRPEDDGVKVIKYFKKIKN